MSYITKNLMPNEAMVIETEMHWIIFFWPLIGTFFLLAFIFNQHVSPLLNYVALAGVVYLLAQVFIRYVCTTYAMTTARVILKQGLWIVRVSDMSLSRIESAELQQSILGRVLGYGNLVVSGTGGDQMVLLCIEDPSTFRQKLFEGLKE